MLNICFHYCSIAVQDGLGTMVFLLALMMFNQVSVYLQKRKNKSPKGMMPVTRSFSCTTGGNWTSSQVAMLLRHLSLPLQENSTKFERLQAMCALVSSAWLFVSVSACFRLNHQHLDLLVQGCFWSAFNLLYLNVSC
jgi:hypothetical protein